MNSAESDAPIFEIACDTERNLAPITINSYAHNGVSKVGDGTTASSTDAFGANPSPVYQVWGGGREPITEGENMSCWNKAQLEQMLEDVVNELDLSESAIEEHGPFGTPPAQLVRLVLDQKDNAIRNLKAGFIDVGANREQSTDAIYG